MLGQRADLPPRAGHLGSAATEVVTDAAPVYPQVLDELVPAAGHVERDANNVLEADRPTQTPVATTRGLQTDRTASVVITGLAFHASVRCGGLGERRNMGYNRGVHDHARPAAELHRPTTVSKARATRDGPPLAAGVAA